MLLSNLIIPPWVKPALCAVALLGAFSAGWKVESLRWTAHEAKALKQAQAATQKQQDHANNEATHYENDRERERQANTARQQSIRTIYRTVTVPAACEPPADALRLLDQALDAANQPAGQSSTAVPAHR